MYRPVRAVEIHDVGLSTNGIEFRLSGSEIDGHYWLQGSFCAPQGVPRSILRDGTRLEIGLADEAKLLAVLREGLAKLLAMKAAGPPDESEGIPHRIVWLRGVAGIPSVKVVIEMLEARVQAP